MFNLRREKYKIVNETRVIDGKTVYRIEALKSFGHIKKGEIGGFVESYDNLSQEGNCWIEKIAMYMKMQK